ncbi:TonB-dependent receptor [Pseudoxanthomonas sp. SL93]|uniref:TonB-dependent receptor n=1 Tax=Pseudoxanthomonas sp. SL93 TaxID=2995142 RepID=UPI00226EE45D|nr:TonB-dependent receptor [Pseudoxanthomonas sp. SL93]WAC63758.1 TonB-dependent receptor [Pseudoxanthomonas sp. SL93]
MNRHTHTKYRPNRSLLACALASCMVIAAPQVLAQSTAATIRGQVSADSAPATGASVTATNVATGLTRSVQTNANGSYSLGGLPPGTYRIDVTAGGQTNSQNVTVAVGQTATLNLGVGGVAESATQGAATTLDTVSVTAVQLSETKTSEVATYVSQKQIEALPQNSRNFLAFADIVPGVVFTTGSEGSSSIRSGAQSSASINVFIDGVGQKDYVLKSGITGQDSSRGNPFPQLGISEYKVVTSNYKAEYDQLSSAAITAVTKSGTNEFHGEFFWDNVTSDWVADTIREADGRDNKADTRDEQYGFSLGGPIVKDSLHFFFAYEAKDRSDARQVDPGRQFEIEDLPAQFQEEARSTTNAPFKEDLYFGKISWTPGDAHLVELTAKRREEDETTNIGGVNLGSYATLKTGEETRVDLRYQYSADTWLNDAHITYEDANFAPRPLNTDIGYRLLIPRIGEENNNNPAMEEIINRGGGGDFQNKGQKGYSIQNDFTFTGWQGHTLKAGIKYKDIDLSAFEQSPYSPQFRYDFLRSLDVPYFVQFTASGNGYPTSVESSAKQFGIYLQDDWEVNEHLTLNMGLRWDYEKNPSYEDHVTPAALVSALQAWPNINNANVDYDYNDYISTGNNRDAFKDGWQPRVGFSYDLNGDQRHVIFGGAGRSYNRNQFDYLSYEKYRLAFQRYEYQFNTPGHTCAPNPATNCYNFDPSMLDPAVLAAMAAANPNNGAEVFLLNNDIKTPYSDQFSLGMRNAFELFGIDWSSSVTLLRIESKDGILWTMGNRYPNGEFRSNPALDWGGQPWGEQLPGWGRFFIGNNAVETTLNSLLVSLEKPYTRQSGWGMSLAYTYSDAEENRSNSDQFSFDYPNLDNVSFTSALGVPEHRLVMTGILDFWGFTASGKLTLATPKYVEAINCYDTTAPGNCYFDPFKPDTTLGFKQFDMALQREWDTGTDLKFRVRADVLNVFNWRNVLPSEYANWRGFDGNPDPNYGNRTGDSIERPTRTFKLSFGLSW